MRKAFPSQHFFFFRFFNEANQNPRHATFNSFDPVETFAPPVEGGGKKKPGSGMPPGQHRVNIAKLLEKRQQMGPGDLIELA
jgi:hypothetical protein